MQWSITNYGVKTITYWYTNRCNAIFVETLHATSLRTYSILLYMFLIIRHLALRPQIHPLIGKRTYWKKYAQTDKECSFHRVQFICSCSTKLVKKFSIMIRTIFDLLKVLTNIANRMKRNNNNNGNLNLSGNNRNLSLWAAGIWVSRFVEVFRPRKGPVFLLKM